MRASVSSTSGVGAARGSVRGPGGWLRRRAHFATFVIGLSYISAILRSAGCWAWHDREGSPAAPEAAAHRLPSGAGGSRRTFGFSLDAWYGFTSALWLWGVYLKHASLVCMESGVALYFDQGQGPRRGPALRAAPDTVYGPKYFSKKLVVCDYVYGLAYRTRVRVPYPSTVPPRGSSDARKAHVLRFPCQIAPSIPNPSPSP